MTIDYSLSCNNNESQSSSNRLFWMLKLLLLLLLRLIAGMLTLRQLSLQQLRPHPLNPVSQWHLRLLLLLLLLLEEVGIHASHRHVRTWSRIVLTPE